MQATLLGTQVFRDSPSNNGNQGFIVTHDIYANLAGTQNVRSEYKTACQATLELAIIFCQIMCQHIQLIKSKSFQNGYTLNYPALVEKNRCKSRVPLGHKQGLIL